MLAVLRRVPSTRRSPHLDSLRLSFTSVPGPGHRSVLVLMALACLGASCFGAGRSRTYPPREGTAALAGVALLSDGTTPWAGARVELWCYGDAPEADLPDGPDVGNSGTWRGITDPDGTFVFRSLPAGRYWVRVSSERPGSRHSGEFERSARVDIGPEDQTTSVRIVRDGLELAGEVLLYVGGPAVMDADIILLRVVHRGGRKAGSYGMAYPQANAQGRFVIDGLEPGEYVLQAEVAGARKGFRETGRTPVVIPEGGLHEPVAVVLKPHALRGTVHAADGSHAARALVVLGRLIGPQTVLPEQLESAPDVLVAHADDQGAFEFPHVGSGRHWIYARGPEEGERIQVVRIEEGEAPPAQDLRLTRCAIEGTLTRAIDGTAQPGVMVTQRQPARPYDDRWGPFAAVTDAAGRFRVPGCDPGEYLVTATRDHRTIAEATIEVEDDRPAEAALAIPDTYVIGRVVRPDGRLVPGADVSIGQLTTGINQDGLFELRGVLPGRQYLAAKSNGGKYSRTIEITVADGSPTRGEIVLPAFTPKVILTVYQPDGRPAAHVTARGYLRYATVGLGGSGSGAIDHQLDPDGRMEFPLKGQSHLQFLVMVPGIGCSDPGEAAVTGLEAEVPCAVHLKPAGSISGIVREGETGRPVGGVMITPRQVGAPGGKEPAWNHLYTGGPVGDDAVFPATASRDGDGTFTLEPLPAAEYELEAWDLFHHNHKVRVTLGPQDNIEGLEITVPRGERPRTVSGIILDADGRPAALRDVELRVWSSWGPQPEVPEFFEGVGKLRRILTGEHGEFTLDPMPTGNWLIVPGDRGQAYQYGVVVRLEGGSVDGVKITLPPEPAD